MVLVCVGWMPNVMWMPMEGFWQLFGGPGDQKVVVWPVASWAKSPRLVWRAIWVCDPGRTFGHHDLGKFLGPEAHGVVSGAFLGSARLGSQSCEEDDPM